LNVGKPNRTHNITKKLQKNLTLVPSDLVPSHLPVEMVPVKDSWRHEERERERESYNQILPPVKNERVDGEMRAGGEGRTAGRRRERERRVRRGNAMHREKERKRRRRVPFLASTDT
jgi:hypothetical protein